MEKGQSFQEMVLEQLDTHKNEKEKEFNTYFASSIKINSK